jgi:NuA3 HAT complex component NTO1
LLTTHSLDPKNAFHEGFRDIAAKLEERYYSSVAAFSEDLGAVFRSVIGLAPLTDVRRQGELNDRTVAQNSLTAEQKDKRTLAKRIIKNIQGLLEEATRREAELGRKPFEREVACANLDALFDLSSRARTQSINVSTSAGDVLDGQTSESLAVQTPTAQLLHDEDVHMAEADHDDNEIALPTIHRTKQDSSTLSGQEPPVNAHSVQDEYMQEDETAEETALRLQLTPQHPEHIHVSTNEPFKNLGEDRGESSNSSAPALSYSSSTLPSLSHPDPETFSPSMAEPKAAPLPDASDLLRPFSQGGIPWYASDFDPDGTTLYDERWTGHEVLRQMSEELSDMDEEAVKALKDDDAGLTSASTEGMTDVVLEGESDDANNAQATATMKSRKKKTTRRYH